MKVAATECEGRPSEYGSNLDDRRWGMQASLPDTLWGQQRKTGPDVERCIDAEVSPKPAWRAVNPSEETMTPCKSATEFIRGSFAVMGIASLTWLLTSAAMAAEVTPPAEIASAGKIVYCSDISGPPLGYFDENNKPIGSDIDLGTEIARRLGSKPSLPTRLSMASSRRFKPSIAMPSSRSFSISRSAEKWSISSIT
jgi:hypothetical protein